MSLTHVGCPACGGALSLAEGQRLVTCRYCGGKSLALIPDAVPRYTVRLAVTVEVARRVAGEFLRKPAFPRALRERGRIQDVRLCYAPFYEIGGTRVGTFLLRESEKPRPPSLDDTANERDFEQWLLKQPAETQGTRVIEQDYLHVGPACDLPELGVDRIPLDSLRRGAKPAALDGYDLVELQRQAVVFSPTKPPNRLVEERERRIAVRGDRTTLLEQRVRLLYYPVWQARYEYRGRPYEIAVDGVRGTVLRARAPRESRRAAMLAVILLGVGAFCVGRPLRALLASMFAAMRPGAWLAGGLEATVGVVLGGAVALALAWLARTVLRQSPDIVVAEGEEGAATSSELAAEEAGGAFDRLVEQWLFPRSGTGRDR